MNEVRPAAQPSSTQLAELILFNRHLSVAERCLMEGYLECKWLIPGCDVADGEFGCE